MADFDVFLKLDGIDGESKDPEFPKCVEIKSYDFAKSNTGTMSGATGGASKVNIEDVRFTSIISKASPLIALRCADGKSIKKATVSVRRATGKGGQQVFLTYTFYEALVSSYTVSGSRGSEIILPEESFALNFKRYTQEYKAQDEDGSHSLGTVTSGWDLTTNQPWSGPAQAQGGAKK